MPVEEIVLTARFKVDLADVDESVISEIHRLFTEYQEIVNNLIEYACSHRIISPRLLWYAKYHELRQKYSILPSHYIHIACQHAASICKSFVKMKKPEAFEGERPVFKGRVIWLDKHLFKLDVEAWNVSIEIHGGRRITLRLLHGRYHDRFKEMRLSEARLVLKGDDDLYLHAIFLQWVKLPEASAEAKVVAVDVNEKKEEGLKCPESYSTSPLPPLLPPFI